MRAIVERFVLFDFFGLFEECDEFGTCFGPTDVRDQSFEFVFFGIDQPSAATIAALFR